MNIDSAEAAGPNVVLAPVIGKEAGRVERPAGPGRSLASRPMALDQHETSTRVDALRDQLKLLADSL